MRLRGGTVGLSLLLLLSVATAVACGAFASDDPPREAPDAAADAPPTVTSPPPPDGPEPCVGEPEWVTPEAVDAGASKLATCGGVNGVDLLSDANHCGRCDHSCQGHACAGGLCEPKVLEPAEGLYGLYDNGLLYSSGSTLKRVESDGGRPFVADLPEGGVYSVATDSTHVYVRQYAEVVRFLLGGGGLESLSMTSITSGPLLLDPTHLFFSGNSSYVAKPKEPADSGTTELFSGTFGGVALAAGGVVALVSPWPGTDVDSELRFATIGGSRLVLGKEKNLIGLAVDKDYVYTLRVDAALGGVYRARLPPNNDGKLELVAADNTLGEPGAPSYDRVFVDATHVYWSRARILQYPDVMKQAKCGGAQVRIAQRVYAPAAFAVFGDMIYSVSSQLVALPK